MSAWRFWLAEQRGTLMAVAIFVVMFTIYCSNHPAGFTPNVVQTAANKGVLLAFVAMAQSLVVMTAGIDLSVGMVFTLTNCLASALVFGTPLQVALGIVAVLAVGLVCGALNGLIVIYGRLQPIVATIATSAVFFGIALWITADARRQGRRRYFGRADRKAVRSRARQASSRSPSSSL